MTQGIHHITAIASNAKKTLDFYTKVLGLRLVKKTVNQDDIETYHLFFGDRHGDPGMDLTFFIFLPSYMGLRGKGLVTTISLAVPIDSLEFWKQRFNNLEVKHEDISERFGRQRLIFYDFDDQKLELVGVLPNEIDSSTVWTTSEITELQAIRNFYSATLSVLSLSSIEPVLSNVYGYKQIASEGNIHLFEVSESKRAKYIEVSEHPSMADGVNAAGTVHHIAFRAKDTQQQQEFRNAVIALGLFPTEVINRFYFQSVYYRTPAGILFEIATDGPGFTADESEAQLGKRLSLPPFLEPERAFIEAHISPLPSE